MPTKVQRTAIFHLIVWYQPVPKRSIQTKCFEKGFLMPTQGSVVGALGCIPTLQTQQRLHFNIAIKFLGDFN